MLPNIGGRGMRGLLNLAIASFSLLFNAVIVVCMLPFILLGWTVGLVVSALTTGFRASWVTWYKEGEG